jgi:hypothetical protein
MRTEHRGRSIRAMKGQIQVTLEASPSDRLVSGSIEAEGAPPTSFSGWIELARVVAERRSSAQAPVAN